MTKINIDGTYQLTIDKNGIQGSKNLSLECMKLVEYSDMNKVTQKLKDAI